MEAAFKNTALILGPGYRIYFGDGDRRVILLGGGTKKRQQDDMRKLRICGLITDSEKKGEVKIPLTRDFKETIQELRAETQAFAKRF